MSDEARRGYGMLARLFLLVGGAFAVLALLQMAGILHFFQGNPLGVALIVLVVGALLWWTVRTAPPPIEAPEEEAREAGEEPGDGREGEGRAPRLRGEAPVGDAAEEGPDLDRDER